MRHIVWVSVLGMAGAISGLASVDKGLLALVPAGTKIVGAVDVAQSKNSDFGRYLLAKAQAEDVHFQEMISQTGFDPRRDLQTVVFAANGPSDTPGQRGNFAILARGTFDQNKIKALAAAKGGATMTTYGGIDIILNGKAAGQQTAIGFLEPGVAVMADFTTLKQMIDSRSAPSILDADLKSKIQSVGAANDAWFVSMVSGATLLGSHPGQQQDGASQAQALKSVVQSSGGVKFGSNIETTVDAVTRSDRDAQSLSDVIRFMASMVQMQRQSDPKAGILANALNGMTLQNTGSAVHFAVTMPEKSLEQLADAGVAPH